MQPMKSRNLAGLLVLSCLTVSLGGLWIGYKVSQKGIPPESPSRENVLSGESDIPATSGPGSARALPQTSPDRYNVPEKIQATTKMMYEYYYEEDGQTEQTEEYAPYYLLDKTEEALRSLYTDWELREFSSERVVLRKTVNGLSSRHYILGVQDGFLAVFYSRPVNGSNLKEITTTHVNALSAEEQKRLREGVPVEGDEHLIRLLEDYGS